MTGDERAKRMAELYRQALSWDEPAAWAVEQRAEWRKLCEEQGWPLNTQIPPEALEPPGRETTRSLDEDEPGQSSAGNRWPVLSAFPELTMRPRPGRRLGNARRVAAARA